MCLWVIGWLLGVESWFYGWVDLIVCEIVEWDDIGMLVWIVWMVE